MEVVSIRLSESLKRKFTTKARKDGMSVSNLLRKLICEDLDVTFKPAKKGPNGGRKSKH